LWIMLLMNSKKFYGRMDTTITVFLSANSWFRYQRAMFHIMDRS
jgi:hypothetical protein